MHISTSGTSIFLYHFSALRTHPMFYLLLALSLEYQGGGAKAPFKLGITASSLVCLGLTFNQLRVAGHLQHVSRLAETLEATTANLKADGNKPPPLLTKLPLAPPRNIQSGDTTASPSACGPAARSGAIRTSVPSKNGWYDHGANKKKRHFDPWWFR